MRSVWTRTLRNEVLRVGKRLARVGAVGVWLATFANADGSRCFPGRDKLAGLTGFSEPAVSRCLQVLEAVGMISGKRRPNNNTEYQLVIPVGGPDWGSVLHIVEETRQKRARAVQKLREIEERERMVSGDTVRTVSPAGVPDSVPGGGSGECPGTPSESLDSVRGHPWTVSGDTVRTVSPAGGTQSPTSGRYPLTHTETAEPSPQPQVRAGARGENDQSPPPEPPHRPAGLTVPCPAENCGAQPGLPCTRLRGQHRPIAHPSRIDLEAASWRAA
ncbi:helix-turn-helix domain-containing protein [Kitasatospora sp. MAP12-22]|uniref:zinc finger domain-containing protein n=1 Tax=Kitasatospora sp. MAP12-22 TaxID=3156301 RepID=UPI003515779B